MEISEKVVKDIYEQYIMHLKSQQGSYGAGTKTEKHRIFPGYLGGTYDVENVVHITFREHTLAHFYRFLAYEKKGDLAAYLFMCKQTEEGRRTLASFAGKIGGKARSKQMATAQELFFDPEWQRIYGYRDAGKRNVESGHLEKLNRWLNRWLTENDPEERSRAGKLGAQARIRKQRSERTAFFAGDHHVQRLANLKRWGVVINGERIPFKKLSSDFIDHYIAFPPHKEEQ